MFHLLDPKCFLFQILYEFSFDLHRIRKRLDWTEFVLLSFHALLIAFLVHLLRDVESTHPMVQLLHGRKYKTSTSSKFQWFRRREIYQGHKHINYELCTKKWITNRSLTTVCSASAIKYCILDAADSFKYFWCVGSDCNLEKCWSKLCHLGSLHRFPNRATSAANSWNSSLHI